MRPSTKLLGITLLLSVGIINQLVLRTDCKVVRRHQQTQAQDDEAMADLDEPEPEAESTQDTAIGESFLDDDDPSKGNNKPEDTGARPLDESSEHDDDDHDDDDSDVAEGSRLSIGGEPAGTPPPWLAGGWFKQPFKDSPGLFGGFLTRLNDHHVLGYRQTCNETQFQHGAEPNGEEQISLTLPHSINTNQMMSGTSRLYGCQQQPEKFLSGDVGIFNLTHHRDWESYYHAKSPQGKLSVTPTIQHDPEVKDNCHLHSYSLSSNPFTGVDAPQAGEAKFTRFAVERKRCEGGICNFRSESDSFVPHGSKLGGAVCPGLADAGAPILCGQDQKLSFITMPVRRHDDGRQMEGCSDFIQAVRLADHHKTLSEYVGKKVEPPLPDMDKDSLCSVESLEELGRTPDSSCPSRRRRELARPPFGIGSGGGGKLTPPSLFGPAASNPVKAATPLLSPQKSSSLSPPVRPAPVGPKPILGPQILPPAAKQTLPNFSPNLPALKLQPSVPGAKPTLRRVG